MNQWKHEAWLLLLDNTKSKTLLWWNPKYNVHDVLVRTLNFYKEYYDWKDMEEYASKEIDAYIEWDIMVYIKTLLKNRWFLFDKILLKTLQNF